MDSTDKAGRGDEERARRRLQGERDRLAAERDRLRDGLGSESEASSLGELADADQHPGDVGTETFDREQAVSLAGMVEGRLRDVEAALRRVDDGTYGRCVACGRRISPDRLDALPATPYCIRDAEQASFEAAPGVASAGGGPNSGTGDSGRAI